ncbi:MAG: hypothetical protein ACREA9_29040 [Pyrinomonadaceae bacterium]
MKLQKIAAILFFGVFVVLKVIFLVKTPKALWAASIPAFILILSSAQSTSAKDVRY